MATPNAHWLVQVKVVFSLQQLDEKTGQWQTDLVQEVAAQAKDEIAGNAYADCLARIRETTKVI